jgi:hypothetical protein
MNKWILDPALPFASFLTWTNHLVFEPQFLHLWDGNDVHVLDSELLNCQDHILFTLGSIFAYNIISISQCLNESLIPANKGYESIPYVYIIYMLYMYVCSIGRRWLTWNVRRGNSEFPEIKETLYFNIFVCSCPLIVWNFQLFPLLMSLIQLGEQFSGDCNRPSLFLWYSN